MLELVTTPHQMELALAIRSQVFVAEQGVPLELERDGKDPHCQHWLAWQQDRAIGTARLWPQSPEVGKIGRVAVLPEGRGQKWGQRLMHEILSWARQQGYRELVLDAQLEALNFYQKLGYQPRGEVFEDCGILHRRMHLCLD